MILAVTHIAHLWVNPCICLCSSQLHCYARLLLIHTSCLTSPHFHSSSLQITPSPLRTLTTDHTVIIIVQYTGHWFWFTAALNSSQPFPNLTCTRPACRATITQRRVAAVHSHFHYRRRILLCWLTKRLITLPSTRFVFYLTWVATTTTGLHESEQSQGVIRHRYPQCCSITEHTAQWVCACIEK